MDFSIHPNQLILKSMKHCFTIFFILITSVAFAQKGTLSGKIIDKSARFPLIGVNIYLKGTSFGTSTDLDGNYRIANIPQGSYNVEVSYIGYQRLILTDIRLENGKTTLKNIDLGQSNATLDEVVIVGDKPIVDIEQTRNEKNVGQEAIANAPTRQIQGVLNTQSGVVLNPEGISIRGGRTYETAFVIDGVSASDPLAGTGFGIDLGTNSISSISVTTGGGDVAYGDGSAGIVATTTKSGSDKIQFTFGHRRDNLGFNSTSRFVWNNEIYETTLGGSIKLKKERKIRYFISGKVSFDDLYFKMPANQVKSSLYPINAISPSQDNRWAGSLKLNYDFTPRKKLAFTYLRSITINQDINMLRITGNNVPFLPGFQYDFMLQPDNANTYTHDTNMETLNWQHTISNKFSYSVIGSRLFVHLRSDANGRDWRPLNVDGEFDPNVIITFPVTYFNPNDSVVFVNPGPGLYNNGGIAPLWHDHYVEEYTLRASANYYYNANNKLSFGTEIKQQDMQWIDILRPWIGAPIILPDGQTSQSYRLGDYSDVWKVNPLRGAFYASNRIKYKGLIAEIGGRLEYWFPGKFLDDAVRNPISPIRDEIREAYQNSTISVGNRNAKVRFLPKISASFPIKENQVMFFNYNHSMVLPHPSFLYAGLNPLYQDRSTLARVGNPNLNPEMDISYELGLRSQLTSNDGLTLSAYWKDKYDFITSASVQIKDQTGREVSRTLSINSDYARVRGIEVSYIKRIGKWFNGQAAFSYMTATGQSSSASESLNQILNNGNREDTKELFLAWDSPIDLKTFANFTLDNKKGLFGQPWLNRMNLYVEGVYRTGRRYTPFIFQGNDPVSGRPVYDRDPNPDAVFSKLGAPNYWVDLNLIKWWNFKKIRLEFTAQATNIFNTLNTIIPNPVTGRGYELGDNVPVSWRDPNYLDPRDSRSNNQPPTNPARYRAPRHVMVGINIKFN